MRVDRNSTSVVNDAAATVLQQRDVDPGGVAGHRLVDGVVDDLVHEVVEAVETGAPDVHPGALPDGLQTLQNGDVLRPVTHRRLRQRARSFSAVQRGGLRAQNRRSEAQMPMLQVYQFGGSIPAYADLDALDHTLPQSVPKPAQQFAFQKGQLG